MCRGDTMGYSHYWTTPSHMTNAQRNAAFARIRSIIGASDVQIGNGGGDPGSAPGWVGNEVMFNGIEECACETFSFGRPGWDYCKTRQRPYDEVVVACLMAIAEEVPGFVYESDGDLDGEDGDAGRALLARAALRNASSEKTTPPLCGKCFAKPVEDGKDDCDLCCYSVCSECSSIIDGKRMCHGCRGPTECVECHAEVELCDNAFCWEHCQRPFHWEAGHVNNPDGEKSPLSKEG